MNEHVVQRQVTGLKAGETRYPVYDAAQLGFANYWYPIMFSNQLGKKPVPLKLFGQDIFLVRDEGRAYAMQDRCPHRGIPLSMGCQEFPGTFTCCYHGWTFNLKSGLLVAALTDGPDSQVCGKARVPTYPVVEKAGIIWIYNGVADNPTPIEADIPSELLDPLAATHGRITERDGDWRHAAENGYDEGHGKYLHRTAAWLFFKHPPAWVDSEIQDEGNGWITRIPRSYDFQGNYPGLGVWPKKKFWKSTKMIARVSIRMPGALRVIFPNFVHFEWYVPTVEGRHRYVQLVTKRRSSAADAALFNLRYKLYIKKIFHGQFNDQDARVVEKMKTPPEQLYRPDTSIIGWRRLCEKPRYSGSST